jgi:hypothetical protein
VKNGDTLEVKLSSRDVPITPSLSAMPGSTTGLGAAAPSAAAPAATPTAVHGVPTLGTINAADATPMHHAEPAKHIPGLAEAIGQSQSAAPQTDRPIRKSIADFIRRDQNSKRPSCKQTACLTVFFIPQLSILPSCVFHH